MNKLEVMFTRGSVNITSSERVYVTTNYLEFLYRKRVLLLIPVILAT